MLASLSRSTWFLVGLVAIAIGVGGYVATFRASSLPIRVGILHSETGTMAISEQSVRDATLLAIEEINRRGGLLGRRVEAVVADGASNLHVFAAEARRLIVDEKVSVVFGCWTSASRKTVIPIFAEHQHLLFYPLQYEGLEESPFVVYTGAAPNQQLVPAVKWCYDELGARKFFLVGSDYVFPRTANEIMSLQLKALGCEVLEPQYVKLGEIDVESIIDSILASQPDVILNTINGDSNLAFFAALRKAGVTPDKIPTMSFSIAENELLKLNAPSMAGDFATWNYFQTCQRAENVRFVKSFQDKYGPERVTDDPIEAGYFGVHLWAQAVQDAGTDEVAVVRKHLAGQSYPAPGGIVSIDPDNQHTWKTVRVGRIRADGQFDVLWTSEQPVRPMPFPELKTNAEWQAFLDDLYVGWDGHWANTAP